LNGEWSSVSVVTGLDVELTSLMWPALPNCH